MDGKNGGGSLWGAEGSNVCVDGCCTLYHIAVLL